MNQVPDRYFTSFMPSAENEATLKRMNRHYTTLAYRDAVHLLRQALPNLNLTADIIVGFPGETESVAE